MSQRQDLLGEDWDALTLQLSKPRAHPPSPTSLPHRKIRLWPGVFQHRGRRGGQSDAHVKELVAAIKKSPTGMLAPMTVWWDGRNWACIDGHHRLDAYRIVASGPAYCVPVEEFKGSLPEAMAQAAASNTKNKLPMAPAEKSNAAWRLVAVNSMSRQETAGVASVSTATIAAMRRVRAQLEARVTVVTPVDALSIHRELDYRNLSWLAAKRLAEGREAIDFDWEEADGKKVQEWATALTKLFGRQAGKRPELLARALDLYDTRLMDQMMEWWQEQTDDADSSEEADEA